MLMEKDKFSLQKHNKLHCFQRKMVYQVYMTRLWQRRAVIVASERRYQDMSPCWTEPVPAGSKMDCCQKLSLSAAFVVPV